MAGARQTSYGPMLWLVLGLLISASGTGQTPEEHASHHPPQNPADPQAMAPQGATPDSMPSREAEHMGAASSREFYPSLMQLGEMTPENRATLERLARERMSSGTTSMSSALEKLNAAAVSQDLATLQDAAEQMRHGVEQFQSGIASLRAISSGEAPRDIALDWFRRSMNLPAADVIAPHGLFGLSAFHYFVMLVLAGSAAALLWMSFRKMQRAQALVARLAGGAEGAPLPEEALPPPPSKQSVPAPVSAAEAPSKPNSWTGLLRVARIFEETPNVKTLRLANPSGNEIPFRHLPGQFVTFTVTPIDQPIKRSYTIASSPTRRDYLEVTVKREEHGTVSSFLHHVHEGDTLQVTGPSGNFTFIGEGTNSIVLISGGVGITPMMSVLRYLTDRSWRGDVFFIYGCKTDQDVIYREELEYLRRRFANLTITIVASQAASAQWPYETGYVTQQLIAKAVPHVQTRRVHLCGPPPMMESVKAELAALGVPAEQIKTEIFIGRERPVRSLTAEAESAAVEGVTPAPQETGGAAIAKAPEHGVAVVTFARSRQTAFLPPNKTVLEASEEAGVNIEYSCRVGVCGVCKVKLLSGSVSMEVQDSLSDEDKRNHLILACQAKCTADISVDA